MNPFLAAATLLFPDKVLVNVLFRGRELAHIDEGRRVMQEVLAALEEIGKVRRIPRWRESG